MVLSPPLVLVTALSHINDVIQPSQLDCGFVHPGGRHAVGGQ